MACDTSSSLSPPRPTLQRPHERLREANQPLEAQLAFGARPDENQPARGCIAIDAAEVEPVLEHRLPAALAGHPEARVPVERLDAPERDFVHVLVEGRIVRSGGRDLALELEERGYGRVQAPGAEGGEEARP